MSSDAVEITLTLNIMVYFYAQHFFWLEIGV